MTRRKQCFHLRFQAEEKKCQICEAYILDVTAIITSVFTQATYRTLYGDRPN
jgi:hypothetical protein